MSKKEMRKISKRSLGIFLNAQVNANVLVQMPGMIVSWFGSVEDVLAHLIQSCALRKVCKQLENNADPNVRIVDVHAECVLTAVFMCVGGGTLA